MRPRRSARSAARATCAASSSAPGCRSRRRRRPKGPAHRTLTLPSRARAGRSACPGPSSTGMKVKMILPALTEAVSPVFRPLKSSLFPPLGLATLAAYLPEGTEIDLQDEHVERLRTDDDPDLVVIQVYITSARRAYALADLYRGRGAYVVLGGL